MQLDVRGEVCPYPMLETIRAMKALEAREEVVVITDHAPCLETIPPQAGRYGYEYAIEQTGSPEWRITLTPKGGKEPS
jgi:tRNA 2-thiouridine synthesizing protein A